MSDSRSRPPGRDRPEPRRPEPRRPETPWVAETEETRGDAPRTGGTRAAGSAAASRPVAAPLSAAPSEHGPTQGPGRALTIRSRQPGIGRALRAGGADDEPVTRSPTVRGIRCCESGLSRRQRGAVKVGGLGVGSHVGSGSPHPSGRRRRQTAARMRGSQGTADTRPCTGQAPEAGAGPAAETETKTVRELSPVRRPRVQGPPHGGHAEGWPRAGRGGKKGWPRTPRGHSGVVSRPEAPGEQRELGCHAPSLPTAGTSTCAAGASGMQTANPWPPGPWRGGGGGAPGRAGASARRLCVQC